MKVSRRILFALLVVVTTLFTPVAVQRAAADGGPEAHCHTGTFCGG